tara:strand:- start:359 stop:643 length:285 start_codon:yes stop_codon:yes gene_type:complete
MSLIDSNNILLREQLGKGKGVVFSDEAQTGKDYYCVHFVTTSVISAITMANHTGESALQTTIPAGTVIYGRITAITMTQGVAIGYTEHDEKTGE